MIVSVAMSGSCNPEQGRRGQRACCITPQSQQDRVNGWHIIGVPMHRLTDVLLLDSCIDTHSSTQTHKSSTKTYIILYTHTSTTPIHASKIPFCDTDNSVGKSPRVIDGDDGVCGWRKVCMCKHSSACRWLTHETSEEHRLADGFIGLPMVNGVIDTMSIIVIIMSSMSVFTV